MNTKIVWFTGLSGSGKTTIADKLCEELKATGKQVMVIDGDVIRTTKHKELSFSPEDIKENNRLIALTCQENVGKYNYILVPIISPFRESREHAREILKPSFIEVFIDTNLDECIRRDVKELYRKALAGQIENFIGVSKNTPYEKPHKPDITINTMTDDVSSSVKQILEYLRNGQNSL